MGGSWVVGGGGVLLRRRAEALGAPYQLSIKKVIEGRRKEKTTSSRSSAAAAGRSGGGRRGGATTMRKRSRRVGFDLSSRIGYQALGVLPQERRRVLLSRAFWRSGGQATATSAGRRRKVRR